jgi:predicted site-specific integrase-resolvase
MEKIIKGQDYVTLKKFCELTGLSRSTVMRYQRAGKIRWHRIADKITMLSLSQFNKMVVEAPEVVGGNNKNIKKGGNHV